MDSTTPKSKALKTITFTPKPKKTIIFSQKPKKTIIIPKSQNTAPHFAPLDTIA